MLSNLKQYLTNRYSNEVEQQQQHSRPNPQAGLLNSVADEATPSQLSVHFSIPFKWVFSIALACFLIGICLSVAFVFEGWEFLNGYEIASISVRTSLGISLLLLFGLPITFDPACSFFNHLPRKRWRLFIIPSLFIFIYAVSQALIKKVDPNSVALLFGLGALVPLTFTENNLGRTIDSQIDSVNGSFRYSRTFTWTDLSMCLLLWLPINNNFWVTSSVEISTQSSEIFLHFAEYQWWRLVIATYIILNWGILRSIFNLGYNMVPTLKDLLALFLCLVILAISQVPLIFIKNVINSPHDMSAVTIIFVWVRQLFSFAIPSELLFRGVIQNGILMSTNREWIAILATSIIYGIANWTRGISIPYQLLGFAYTTFSSCVLGFAYLKTNQLFSPIYAHSIHSTYIKLFVSLPQSALLPMMIP